MELNRILYYGEHDLIHVLYSPECWSRRSFQFWDLLLCVPVYLKAAAAFNSIALTLKTHLHC